MKSSTCAVAEKSAEKGPELTAVSAGKIRLAAKKDPRHVLVVDDEPLIRWSVAESLADIGYDVEQAPDASSALRIITAAGPPFDAVILDLRLPDMHDLSLLGTVRQLLPGASVILMTAFGTPELKASAVAMGAVVINKPFEMDEMTRLVTSGEL